jgi:hypothetical protein
MGFVFYRTRDMSQGSRHQILLVEILCHDSAAQNVTRDFFHDLLDFCYDLGTPLSFFSLGTDLDSKSSASVSIFFSFSFLFHFFL